MLGLRQHIGFSLIELMISMVLSMIVVLGGINLYISIVGSSKDTYQRNHLTEELRAISGTLTKDVRRAGYWGVAPGIDVTDLELTANPFTDGVNDLVISQNTGEATDSCILYTYDLNLDGNVSDPNDASNTSEQFGFRLNTNAVEMFTGGAISCSTGTWEAISTPEINISTLSFTLNETCLDVIAEAVEACPCQSGDACQHLRRVDFTLSGQLTSEPRVSETLFESVTVRNDKFVLSVP